MDFGWSAVKVEEDQARTVIASGEDLDGLKSNMSDQSGLIVFVPNPQKGTLTYGAFADALTEGNDSISAVEVPKGASLDDKFDPESSRCFRVIYSTGQVTYECWQGTGIGGRWAKCAAP